MRKLLVVFLSGVAALGLAGCGGGGSSKSKTTTPPTTHAVGGGGSAPTAATLSSYLKCLGAHGVNVKKAAASKAPGGRGAALKKDPHYASAAKACK
jgi:ABC-type glycerol-3-phosphate transport system substrate-binding protein